MPTYQAHLASQGTEALQVRHKLGKTKCNEIAASIKKILSLSIEYGPMCNTYLFKMDVLLFSAFTNP